MEPHTVRPRHLTEAVSATPSPPRAVLVLAAALIAVVVLSGCGTTHPPRLQSEQASPGELTALINQLEVAQQHWDGYDRDLFKHWVDADSDGCDTRCEVLQRQTSSDGGWVSVYDGYVSTDAGTLHVDHVVPLAEAWRSGAWQWSAQQHQDFANDLDSPELIAVSAESNMSKSDSDPAKWLPPDERYTCNYLQHWVQVKLQWHLTADADETAAMLALATDCG